MRLLRFGSILLVVLCLFTPATGAFAPQPPKFVTASVTFRDADGDRIRSDGNSYVDGAQRGLEVRMWVDGSRDLTIGLFNSGRKLRFSYQPEPGSNASAPWGSLEDNAFVNVRAIADMPIGSTRITKASFDTAIGHFRWLGSPFPPGGVYDGVSFDSQAVKVERTSDTTWEVSTPDPAELLQDPITQAEALAGDLSVLLVGGRKGQLTPAALYRMPFGLTVTCTACATQ